MTAQCNKNWLGGIILLWIGKDGRIAADFPSLLFRPGNNEGALRSHSRGLSVDFTVQQFTFVVGSFVGTRHRQHVKRGKIGTACRHQGKFKQVLLRILKF